MKMYMNQCFCNKTLMYDAVARLSGDFVCDIFFSMIASVGLAGRVEVGASLKVE